MMVAEPGPQSAAMCIRSVDDENSFMKRPPHGACGNAHDTRKRQVGPLAEPLSGPGSDDCSRGSARWLRLRQGTQTGFAADPACIQRGAGIKNPTQQI